MKIIAKELRIGNYLQDPEGNVVEVIRLHENGTIEVHSDIHQFHDFNESDEDILFSPITICEEILLMVGFVDLGTEYCESFLHDRMLFEFIPDGTIELRIMNRNDSQYALLIKHNLYLHQLQNLYFELNQRDLNSLKLPINLLKHK